MNKKSFFAALAVICAGMQSVAWEAPAALQVISASPKGAANHAGRTPVTLTFNQPVAALAESAAFSSAECPVRISPSVAGTCRTSGTQSIVFEPAQEWAPATTYNVRLDTGFASAVSGAKPARAYAWSFTTQTPAVVSSRPWNGERWMDLRPTLYFAFNMPVDFKTLPGYMRLSYKDASGALKTAPVQARAMTKQETEKEFAWYDAKGFVAVEPVRALERGVTYTFSFLPGLRAAGGGDAGMSAEYSLDFSTYPPLKVLGETARGCLPYTPAVHFSAPVRMRDFLAAAEVTPASARRALSEAELDALGREEIPAVQKGLPARPAYFRLPLAFLDLVPGESVQIKIKKDLKDIYGNALGKDYSFSVQNEGYCPKADLPGGFGVLESYLNPFLPVKLMNMDALPVRAARFSKENFVPFDQQNKPYCSEAELKELTYEGEYSFPAARNKTVRSFLDLAGFNPTSKDSIVFSQVKVPSARKEGFCWVSSTTNITDLGVTFKTSPDSTLLWVTSLKTAAPQPNLTVELRSRENKVLWSGTTDMNGLCFAPGWKDLDVDHGRWGRPEIYAFVSGFGGDAVVSSSWNDGLEPWRFNIHYDYAPQDVTTKAALFSDRGIYRPGETVYIKGAVRSLKDGAWTIPSFTRGTLSVFNARGEEAFKKDVTLSSVMGTFDASVPLPKDAYTGEWSFSFSAPDAKEDVQGAYHSFRVEAVKQADFKVNLHAAQDDYISGADADFNLSAQYQFGAPLADAGVKWTLRQSFASFHPQGYDGYVFTPYFLNEDNRSGLEGKEAGSGAGRLDAAGALSFRAALPQVASPMWVFAEAGVQSPSRQELFSRARVTVHPGAFYLGAKTAENNVELGDALKAHIAAVLPSGSRTSAAVTAEIRKEQWMSVRKSGLSGRLEWISEKKVTPVGEKRFLVPEGGYDFSFTPAEAGSYFVTLSSQDASGRKITGGFTFMVYGKGEAFWKRTDDDILQLTPDKDEYDVGKSARISVKSPYETAQALVTVEREGVLDAWMQTLKGGADYIDVPVKLEYLPNVYVGVTLVSGRAEQPKYGKDGLDLAKPQGKMGYANLKVTPKTRRLSITVQTDKKEYRPGQEVTVKLTSKLNGKAAPAEITVMAVDEGVLSLTAYKTPDLFSSFYGPRALSVSSMDNRMFVIGQRNFGEKGENRGGGGSDAKLGGVDLRSRFEFTPFFNAAVQTDAKGRAKVTFKLPDNLTGFRIMAVGIAKESFGSAQSEIKVSKPLMVSANLPRFARKGDKFSCGAVVYNYGKKQAEVTVSAQASGAVRLTGAPVQTLHIAPGKAREAAWPCEAQADGPAQIAFTAKAKKESDGMRAEITVSSAEKPQTLAVYGSASYQTQELLAEPGSVNPGGRNAVTVSVSSTALLNLKGSMLYLLTYPYDCLEQKMSKIRPVISGAELVEDFKLGSAAQMKAQTQDILNAVGEYQYPSGGLGYWKGSLPDPYVTAYALETAYLAKAQGYKTDEKVLKSAADWLQNTLGKKEQTAYPYSARETQTASAYAVYVLALYGRAVRPAFNNLYEKHASLPLLSRAYLLKAAQALQASAQVKTVLAQSVFNACVILPETMYFEDAAELPWLHAGRVSVSAQCLEALLFARVEIPEPYKAVRWLMTQMNAQGHWANTHANAAVFGALNAYYRRLESDEPDFTASIESGARLWLEAAFKGRTLEEKTVSVPFDTVYASGRTARVTLAKSGKGTLFYTLAQTYEPSSLQTPVNAGFEVSRSVTEPDGSPVRAFKAGRRYKVTLTVRNASARQFAVLEDFPPAGFEIVHTSLATESAAQAAALDNPSWGGFERSEKYDGRIAAFADWLEAGEHTWSYLVSASVPGTFSYPGAWAGQMYESAVFGRSASGPLVIEP